MQRSMRIFCPCSWTYSNHSPLFCKPCSGTFALSGASQLWRPLLREQLVMSNFAGVAIARQLASPGTHCSLIALIAVASIFSIQSAINRIEVNSRLWRKTHRNYIDLARTVGQRLPARLLCQS
jgi:hypothetical protein